MQVVTIKGLSHITGGGISENLPRVLPPTLHAEVDTTSWQQGPVFDWLAEHGNIAVDEMRRTFNCGIGMIVVVSETDLATALTTLHDLGENAWHLGQIATGDGQVNYL
jgi:phosphoribosylformylglycinamidine cyclo-ligase